MSTGKIPTPPPFASNSGLNIPSKDVNIDKSSLFQVVYFILHIATLPVTFPMNAMFFMLQQTKNISSVVLHELNKVVVLAFNVLELSWLVIQSANILLFKDGNTKPLMPRMMDVYTQMANVLTDIHALPSTQESGTLMHLMLNRLPKSIWDSLLPYPHPFFRDSVTQASKTKSNDLIVSTERVPNDHYLPVAPGEKMIVYAQ